MIGIFVHNTFVDRRMHSYMFDLLDGYSWLEVVPWVTGYLLNYGDNLLKETGREVEEVTYSLRSGHPVYEIMRGCYGKAKQPEQNYYRISDMSSFLCRIKPVLEKRIQESFICGYTRKVSLQLFELKRIITIHFEAGVITNITSDPNHNNGYFDIHMPLEYFMHLIFGQKDIDDYLDYNREVGSWNDGIGIDNEFRILLKVLFPKMPSHINHCL